MQLTLLDFTQQTTNEIGNWTFSDLKKWAESIVTGWKVEPFGKTQENIICKRNRREINLHLGQVLKHDIAEYEGEDMKAYLRHDNGYTYGAINGWNINVEKIEED